MSNYRTHAGDVYSERVDGSGAIRVSGEDAEGYRVEIVYYGYTRRESVAMFRQDSPTYWHRLTGGAV